MATATQRSAGEETAAAALAAGRWPLAAGRWPLVPPRLASRPSVCPFLTDPECLQFEVDRLFLRESERLRIDRRVEVEAGNSELIG